MVNAPFENYKTPFSNKFMSLSLAYTCHFNLPTLPQRLSTLELGEILVNQHQELLSKRELAHFVKGPIPPQIATSSQSH